MLKKTHIIALIIIHILYVASLCNFRTAASPRDDRRPVEYSNVIAQ